MPSPEVIVSAIEVKLSKCCEVYRSGYFFFFSDSIVAKLIGGKSNGGIPALREVLPTISLKNGNKCAGALICANFLRLSKSAHSNVPSIVASKKNGGFLIFLNSSIVREVINLFFLLSNTLFTSKLASTRTPPVGIVNFLFSSNVNCFNMTDKYLILLFFN